MDDRIKLYLERVNEMLTADPFYKKLSKEIDKGFNSYKIIQKKSSKVVDQDWIIFIEDVLPSIDTIVRNPRKFIVVEEDIIDISLAKSITKESVKHLATHTNFISAVDGDQVIPSKILNVQKEESYEIYENRFLFTLLKKLQEFVNKRYELIKKSLIDSDVTQISLESKYQLNEAQLIFRLDTIANMGFEEVTNMQTDDLTDYERIARMENIVNGFMNSAFAKEMKSSAPVRPPIMHTNVIKKDPNFKNALKLWEFIYSYDKPGFHVDYINENTPITKEVDPNYKAIMYLNHLVITDLFNKNNPEFAKDTKNISNSYFDSKHIFVNKLEIYYLKKQKEIKELLEKEKSLIDLRLANLKEENDSNTVKVLNGYLLTNKFSSLEKTYLKGLKNIILNLKKHEYKPYKLQDVINLYTERIKKLVFNAFTELNKYNFEGLNEEA